MNKINLKHKLLSEIKNCFKIKNQFIIKTIFLKKDLNNNNNTDYY